MNLRPINPSSVTHRNNFDAMRLLAAAMVFFSHGFAIYGLPEPVLIPAYKGAHAISFGTVAVSMFFVISGYLITKSWQDTGDGLRFIRKRLLRLYPAIFLNFLLVACLIGPLHTVLPGGDYWISLGRMLPELATGAVSFTQPSLPGVFTENPIPHAVNGSLWTLPYEALCYLLVLTGWLLPLRFALPLIAVALVVVFGRELLFPEETLDLPYLHVAAFLTGGMMYLWRERVPLHRIGAGLAVAILAGLALTGAYLLPLYLLAICYLTLFVCLKAPWMGNAARYGDISYGLYIYAWPVQQAFAAWMLPKEMPLALFMLASFAVTAAFAFLSWHGVEKPALRRK
jgi:peptidoglycan/LPS O-acetylase OafA/YrhL